MAAFLKNAPPRGASTAAESIVRLNHTVAATLSRQASARPTLVCHWLQDAGGRLSCYWDVELPDIPIPPH